MKKYAKSDIRRWMKRHRMEAWFSLPGGLTRLSLIEFEKLGAKMAARCFHYDANGLGEDRR